MRFFLVFTFVFIFVSCNTDAPFNESEVDDSSNQASIDNDRALPDDSTEEKAQDDTKNDEGSNDTDNEKSDDTTGNEDSEETDNESLDEDNESPDENEVSDNMNLPEDGLDESFIAKNKGLSFKVVSEISSSIGDLRKPETISSKLKLEDGATVSLNSEVSHIMSTYSNIYIILSSEEDVDGVSYAARVEIPVDNLKALTDAGENSFNKDGDFLLVDVIKQWKKDESVIRCPVQINVSPFRKSAFYVLSENMSWIGGEKMGVMMNTEMISERKEIAKAYGSLFYHEACSCAIVAGTDETPRDCSFDDVDETPPECVKNSDCTSDGKTICDLDQSSSTYLTCVAPVEVTKCYSDSDCAGNTDGKIKCDLNSSKCVLPNEICTEITLSDVEWRGKNSFNGYVYRAEISPNIGTDHESKIGKVLPDYIYFEFYGSDYSSPVSFDLGDAGHSDYDTTNEAVLVKENETSSYYGRMYYQSEGTLGVEKVQGTQTPMTEHSKVTFTDVKLVEMDSEDPRCLRINGSWDTTEGEDPCEGGCEEPEGTVGDSCSSPMITVTQTGTHTFATDDSDYTNAFSPSSSCSSASASTSFDYVFKLELSARSSVVIDVTEFNSTVVPDTVIYLSSTCGNSDHCNDDKGAMDYLSKIDTTLDAGTYFVVLDTFYGDYGTYSVNVTVTEE